MKDEKLTPPESAKNNAKKALEWREKYPDQTKGTGTQVGWTRARQLAEGGELSPDIVKRMAQFKRHQSNASVDPKFKDEPWRDKGYLMYLAWGGESGVNWAVKKAESMKSEAKDMSPDEKSAYVMREFEKGDLKSSSGEVVTSREQAKAIALSESGQL